MMTCLPPIQNTDSNRIVSYLITDKVQPNGHMVYGTVQDPGVGLSIIKQVWVFVWVTNQGAGEIDASKKHLFSEKGALHAV